MFDPLPPHPLLAQIPLTISPFIQIPTAPTLPYSFRSVPTSLPPSVTDTPAYIQSSSSGHSASIADIVKANESLRDHLAKTKNDGDKALAEFEQKIKDRELAEKRRIAPGYLDTEQKILLPTSTKSAGDLLGGDDGLGNEVKAQVIVPRNEGEEIDRAFGGLKVK